MKKVALVTGAASGIGLACAERLAHDGCAVVLADVNEKAGLEESKRIGGTFVAADLTQRAGCRNLVQQVLKNHGTVHILVNNAGYQHVAPIEDFPEDQWERMIALMLTAPFLLTRYCWPAMKKQKWGRIVNMGSIHAVIASPFKVGYIAAKHGLVGLTRTAALEGGEHGITVNAICPGFFPSKMTRAALGASGKLVIEGTPTRRLGNDEDLKGLVVLLASEALRHITGQAIAVDGGASII